MLMTYSLSGTYNPETGSSEPRACINCPAGKYCETAGLQEPTGKCSVGYYCLEKSTTSQVMVGAPLPPVEVFIMPHPRKVVGLITCSISTICYLIWYNQRVSGHELFASVV